MVTSGGISHIHDVSLQMLKSILVLLPVFFASVCILNCGDEIPGSTQRETVALKNATVHTVVNGVLKRATVVFANGKIEAVGTDVPVPTGARVIDCKGGHVYPGFIAPVSTIGLTEIDAVRATRDMAESGPMNPNARGETAYNPDSELIPTIRYNGVLLANVAPEGGSISGMSSLMRLDGWNQADITVRPATAMMVNWPNMELETPRKGDDQQKEVNQAIDAIRSIFREARAYASLVKVDSTKRDIRLEALAKVFTEQLPVFVRASSRKQLESALDFRREFELNMTLVGATDAPLIIERLQKEGVGVIIRRVHSLPSRDEDPYDAPFSLAATLAAAKVQFAFSDDGGWQQRNLPFQAGTAVAFGLSDEDAIRSLTLVPATMLGVHNQYGSIEVGKSATLFVSMGNALDVRSNVLTHAFIDGKAVELTSRHTKLSNKYRQRYAR